MKGKIINIKPEIKKSRLKVGARIETEEGELVLAYLPSREVAAVLPRQILLGKARKSPVKLLDTIQPILSRLIAGRTVRIWQYGNQYYFGFLSWNEVIFEEEQPAGCSSNASEFQKLPIH